MKNTIKFLILNLLTLIHHTHAGFLLLMGPSGVGKSTIINYLKQYDSRFVYVSPFTTRELREGEKDKIHVSKEEIEQLQKDGKLLTVNYFYNNYYATPKYIIDEALAEGIFPILDWPVEKINIMEEYYQDVLFKVYIEPETTMELAHRLHNDNRDLDGKRYSAGLEEIEKLNTGIYDNIIDMRITNKNNCVEQIAKEIYEKFINFENNK